MGKRMNHRSDPYRLNSLAATEGANPIHGAIRWEPHHSLWNGGKVMLRRTAIAIVGLIACSLSVAADVTLKAHITPANIEPLRRLACDNFGHPVQLDIRVSWPSAQLERETENYKRLVFWTADSGEGHTEYLFPSGVIMPSAVSTE